MKKYLLFIVFCLTCTCISAQVVDTTAKKKVDTKSILPKDTLSNKRIVINSARNNSKNFLKTASQGIKAKSHSQTSQTDSAARTTEAELLDSNNIKQAIDSVYAVSDSLQKDSLSVSVKSNILNKQIQNWQEDTLFTSMIKALFKKDSGQTLFMINEQRQSETKDVIFYLLVVMSFFLAFIKAAFPRYFQNLFRLFSKNSFRQMQSREKLRQDNLPSLFLNLLFIISGGLFITLLVYRHGQIKLDFWLLFMYSVLMLASIYSIKYLIIKFSGWVFSAKAASNMYAFIVFLTNKIIGIFLVPIAILVAFTDGAMIPNFKIIALVVVGLLFVYRFIFSFAAIRNNLKISPLHFFIYLCAVELIPILIMFKVLFKYIGKII